jgi:hypothetical protein
MERTRFRLFFRYVASKQHTVLTTLLLIVGIDVVKTVENTESQALKHWILFEFSSNSGLWSNKLEQLEHNITSLIKIGTVANLSSVFAAGIGIRRNKREQMASYIDTNSSKLPNLAELLRTHRLLLFVQRDDALEIARKERVRISAQQQQAESHLQQLENRLNAQQQAMQQLETALMPTNEQSNDNSRVSIYK